ncbi:MAG TPA: helix-turn-helix domain-containing protein [Fervidobacterium sp.]|nr:helix-turn-helix domain-containing protein [Fervidobacterium sp.]HQE49085.1 helix-turn-helix domain-containing protein [Fervidobacterium sp.]HUM42919.1 helix-turn-helix domain-containing protein [Fervidobacterium sp.]
MLRAYKYRIYPTKEQQEYFAKVFGCVRLIYNKNALR